MSEDFPQGEQDLLPPQEQQVLDAQTQQGVEQQTGQVGDNSEQGQTTDQAEDARWDKQKAETLAATLIDDSEFNDDAKGHNDVVKDHAEGLFVQSRSKAIREKLEDTQAKRDDYVDNGVQIPVGVSAALEKYQTLHDETVSMAEQQSAESVEGSKEQLDGIADKILSPFEELYDTNPDVFANMPTSEFMVIGKELATIDGELDYTTALLDDLELDNRFLNSKYMDQQGVPRRDADNEFRRVSHEAIQHDDETFITLDDKIKEIYEGSFDKSPRQILDELKAMSDSLNSRLTERKATAEQRRKELLDSHKPNSEAAQVN